MVTTGKSQLVKYCYHILLRSRLHEERPTYTVSAVITHGQSGFALSVSFNLAE